MTNTTTYEGLLCIHGHGEADDILFLSSVHDPLAQELEWLSGQRVCVRYWITDKPATKEQAQESFVRSCMGLFEGQYRAHYSETTGYLWTDEDLNVGGHDIMAELRSYVGRWLILEVETGGEYPNLVEPQPERRVGPPPAVAVLFPAAKLAMRGDANGGSGRQIDTIMATPISAGTGVDLAADRVSSITKDLSNVTRLSGVRYEGTRLFLGDFTLTACQGYVCGVLLFEPDSSGQDGLPFMWIPHPEGNVGVHGGDLLIQYHGAPALIL